MLNFRANKGLIFNPPLVALLHFPQFEPPPLSNPSSRPHHSRIAARCRRVRPSDQGLRRIDFKKHNPRSWLLKNELGGNLVKKLDGGSNMFYFHPETWEDEPILTSIFFQMGWFNHQLGKVGPGIILLFLFVLGQLDTYKV